MLQNVNRQQLKVLQEYKSHKSKYLKGYSIEKYVLLESFLVFDCKCSREGTRLWMTRLRITMVKILKSNLGIVRTSSYFHYRHHFRKIIMTDRIKTATLSVLVTIRNIWIQPCKSPASLTLGFLHVRGTMPVILNSLIF
jgi:hypothetical protein